MRRKTRIIITRIIEVVALLILSGMLLLQSPGVQTRLAQDIVDKLEQNINADISFSAIKFAPFTTLIIKDFAIIDKAPEHPLDTLMSASHVSATFTLRGLLAKKGGVHVDRLRTKDFCLNLITYDQRESDGAHNNFESIFGVPDPNKAAAPVNDLFSIRRANLDNFRYRMINLSTNVPNNYSGHGINWFDLDLSADARGRNINFVDGRCSFHVDFIRVKEKCGYEMTASGDCITGRGSTEVTNARIRDKWSDIQLKSYTMNFGEMVNFQDFLHKVSLGGDATASPLGLKTISYFAGVLKDCPLSLDLKDLKVSGPVDDMQVQSLVFTDNWSGVKADVSAGVQDIFTLQNAYAEFESRQFEFTPETLIKFIKGIIPELELDLADFAQGVNANLTGYAEGPLNGLKTELKLHTNMGELALQGELNNLCKPEEALSYNAAVNLNELDLGKLGLGDTFGKSTLRLKSHGALQNGKPDISLDTLAVQKLTIFDYAYTGIDGSGVYKSNTFTGNLRCHDPNLDFILGGSFSVSERTSRSIYKFNLSLPYADLAAIKIDKRPGKSRLSTSMNINLRSTEKGILLGEAAIHRLNYTDDDGKHSIGDIRFMSVLDQERIRINLKSNFADLSYSGDPYLGTILDPLMACTLHNSIPTLFHDHIPQWNGRTFEASVQIKDTKEALAFLHKDIYIAPGTSATLSLKSNSTVQARINSDVVRYQNSVLKDLDIKLSSLENTTDAALNIKSISLNGTPVKDFSIKVKAEDNNTDILLALRDVLDKDINADFDLQGNFKRNSKGELHVDAALQNSKLEIGKDVWTISQPVISWENGTININDFALVNGFQTIGVNGAYSETTPSELRLSLQGVDLGIINLFTEADMDMKGTLSGFIKYSTPSRTNAGLMVDLNCPELSVRNTSAGSFSLSGHLDDEDDLIKFKANNTHSDGSTVIKAEGNYNAISNFINARLNLNDFNPDIVQPALANIFSELSGAINGRVTVTGNLNKPDIRCKNLNIKNTKVGLVPTGVTYTLNGDLSYDANGLSVEKLDIRDSKAGSAELSGLVPDLTLSLNHLDVLDKHSGASNYYGDLALNGEVKMRQDQSNLMLEANLSNAGAGKISISLGDINENEGTLLQFKEVSHEEVDINLSTQLDQESSPLKLEAKCRLNVTPGLELVANLDKEGSNFLTISGEGAITADLNPTSGAFSLGGTYNITDGKYHFSALASLISKDFTINDGSTVTFNGDIMDTELDINATHTLKTSVGTLIADTTALGNRRIVNCGIAISDKIRNPGLNFSIDIPDLDPTTKSLVDSELNTEDKINRQFLSLVVLGNFLPGEQSGIVNTTNNSNLISSGLSVLMAGSLNTLLNKFNIPLDLDLSYRQNQVGNDMVDVGVSTQLFDNMVQVSGSVGNRKFSSTSDESVVGDLDISIKLNRSGHFKFNIFSHSADDYTNFLDNSQRNGVGVSYQKEYDNFWSFLKGIFRKKEEQKQEVVPTKRIVIKNEQR